MGRRGVRRGFEIKTHGQDVPEHQIERNTL
jgi:hypothetical protein